MKAETLNQEVADRIVARITPIIEEEIKSFTPKVCQAFVDTLKGVLAVGTGKGNGTPKRGKKRQKATRRSTKKKKTGRRKTGNSQADKVIAILAANKQLGRDALAKKTGIAINSLHPALSEARQKLKARGMTIVYEDKLYKMQKA